MFRSKKMESHGGGTKSPNRKDQSEEEDLLRRNKRRNKGQGFEGGSNTGNMDVNMEVEENNNRSSYKEAAMGVKGRARVSIEVDLDDGAISDDDVMEESTDPSWFQIGMMRDEKWRARQPWWNSLIIKLAGRSIGYHYLYMASDSGDVEDECRASANRHRE